MVRKNGDEVDLIDRSCDTENRCKEEGIGCHKIAFELMDVLFEKK